jgi:hypothetical protein
MEIPPFIVVDFPCRVVVMQKLGKFLVQGLIVFARFLHNKNKHWVWVYLNLTADSSAILSMISADCDKFHIP